MNLDAYFERIGYDGAPQPNEATLFALHEAHLRAIPYENLDIQLGHEKLLDEGRFEARLVGERRGGWCYEMNGLFSAALRKIGFRVDRLGGALMRDVLGDAGLGHHMVLTVDLGHRLVADVGLGDGPLHPFPLQVGEWSEAGATFRLERTDDDWWRFHNQEHGLAPRFDFQETPRDLAWYQEPCTSLHADGSPFVGLALMFGRDGQRIRAVRDLTCIDIEGGSRTEHRIETREAYAQIVAELVGLEHAPDVERLWGRVSTRVAERAKAREATPPTE